MPVIDLHTHSKYSDGTSKPSEVVVEAAKRKVCLYALTDHDTMEGVGEAQAKCTAYNIPFVTGVEVSTKEHDHLHFLGLNISLENKKFNAFLETNRSNRIVRIKKIIKQIAAAGFSLSEDDVFKIAKGAVSRAHVADAIKNKGYASTRQEAFRKFLIPGAVGYVESLGVSVIEAITFIKEAGGQAVIAHPGLTKEYWNFKAWKDAGLDGLEVFYPSHNQTMIQELLSIAREYNFFVTAGSDHHGAASGRTPKPGMEIPPAYYEELIKALKI